MLINNFMKILILGDSFCADDKPQTWPDFLRQLGHDVTTIGQGGASNYVILENFKKHYNEIYDYIIIALSNESRIPFVNGPKYLCNHRPGTSTYWKKRKNVPDEFETAVEGWLKYFYDPEFSKWISKNVVTDINQSVQPSQTIIWVDAVLDDSSIMNNATGIKLRGSLRNQCLKEILDCGLTWKEYTDKVIHDPRKNHFSTYNNQVLGQYFNDIIVKHQTNTLTEDFLSLETIPTWITDKDMLTTELLPY